MKRCSVLQVAVIGALIASAILWGGLAEALASGSANSLSAKCQTGEDYLSQGRYSEAADQFRQVMAVDPAPDAGLLTRAKSSLADCYVRLDDIEQATPLYKELTEQNLIDARLLGWLKALAFCYSASHKITNCLATLDAALAKADPDDIPGLKGLYAKYCVGFRRLDAAVAKYEELVRDYPNSHDAAGWRLELLRCYNELGRCEDALAKCQEFAAVCPANSAKWLYWSAFACKSSGQIGEAVLRFEQFIEDYPSDDYVAESQRQLSLCYAQTGRQDEALTVLDRLYESSADKPQALIWKAELLRYYLRDHDRAIAELFKLIGRFPTDPRATDANRLIGLIMIDQDRTAEARQWFTVLVASEPDNAQWSFALTYCDYQEKDYETARDALRALIDRLSADAKLIRINYELIARAMYVQASCLIRLSDSAGTEVILTALVQDYGASEYAGSAGERLKKISQSAASRTPTVAAAQLNDFAGGTRTALTLPGWSLFFNSVSGEMP